ncbi:PhzF family phenazine biosynthesis protein [Streptomyces sp. NPDC054834]
MRPRKPRWSGWHATCRAQGVYVVVIGDERPVAHVSARFFNPGSGLDEDPATGSAPAQRHRHPSRPRFPAGGHGSLRHLRQW